MLSAAHAIESHLPAHISWKLEPTPISTITLANGAPATLWNVSAHEYFSSGKVSTHTAENARFLQGEHYFAAADDGRDYHCHFTLHKQATCVESHDGRSRTTTFKHARPFVTAYEAYTTSSRTHRAKTSEATSTSNSAAVAPATQMPVAAHQTQQQIDALPASPTATKAFSTSAAAVAIPKLPILAVASIFLLSAVLAFPHHAV
jgi:hypothetical protein